MVKIFKASNKATQLDKELKLNIERLDINGLGVAQYKGKPVFVAQALPHEQVTVKVIEHKNKYLKAKLISVKKKSEHRIAPLCQHFDQCGGCDLQHLEPAQQREFKQKKITDLFARQQINNLPWSEPIYDQAWHYRRKARIGVQFNRKGEPIIGFRKRQSNEITPIKNCPVLTEPLAHIFAPLRLILEQLSLHKSIGHIEVFSTDTVILVIRQLQVLNDVDTQLWLDAMSANHWQVYIDDGNSIKPLMNSSQLSDKNDSCGTMTYPILEHLHINFRPTDFIQVNQNVNDFMVAQAVNWLALSPSDNVLDLFCGLGNFSVAIAEQVKQVIGVEGVEAMSSQARLNASLNKLNNCQFYHADLNANWPEQQWAQQTFDKILLDPARAGALEACQQLVEFRAKLIVYVSCDPTTLARDSKVLLDAGYKITKIALIDMFSQTKHVETMVLFQQV